MDNKITLIGNMLEVNKIEVTIKQFVNVIELGLTHNSVNDLYNELIGGYVFSGYKYDESFYPLFDLRVNNQLVPEFKNDFSLFNKEINELKFDRGNNQYYLVYIQELERCTSSIEFGGAYDPKNLSMSFRSIKLENGSEYKVVNPLYLNREYETEISYITKESYFALKSDGRLINLELMSSMHRSLRHKHHRIF